MANTPSAKKRIRNTLRKTDINKSRRSRIKTFVKKVEDAIETKDEFQELEMNRLLTASIDYYENESVTIDKIETGLSVSLLRDRLNKYTKGILLFL